MMAEQLLRIIWGVAPLSQTMPQNLKGAVFVGDFMFSLQIDVGLAQSQLLRCMAAPSKTPLTCCGADSTAGHGRSARNQTAALHDHNCCAWRRNGGDCRCALCSNHNRASLAWRRNHYDRICRRCNRRVG